MIIRNLSGVSICLAIFVQFFEKPCHFLNVLSFRANETILELVDGLLDSFKGQRIFLTVANGTILGVFSKKYQKLIPIFCHLEVPIPQGAMKLF